jgi:glycosyltransferase involved in cell wall biosynthesis
MVPARNEEDVLGACLESLVQQSGEDFQLGRHWELFVIDDGSEDRTRAIAQQLDGVQVLDAEACPSGWTGKSNALWTAAKVAQGEWLLFTDADTIHRQGDLERAIHEAEAAKWAMLSYSPQQLAAGFWQRALMPIVFSELALAYPPAKISDPAQRTAAANGQFLLVRRDAYFAVGGHSAVAQSLLEDVDLAGLLKRRKYAIRLRYAADALSVRMYRSTAQMLEGWTKNLARLFALPLMLAAWRLLDWLLLVGLPFLVWLYFAAPLPRYAFALLWARVAWRVFARARKSHFPAVDCSLAFLGLPLFCMLLVRSWFHHTIRGQVAWKGRSYPTL